MQRYLLSLALGILLVSFGPAEAKSPNTTTTTPVLEKGKAGQSSIPNIHTASCSKAKEDLQRQAENLPSVANAIVECVNDGQNLDYCDTRLDSFKQYYSYMRDAAQRIKRYCTE